LSIYKKIFFALIIFFPLNIFTQERIPVELNLECKQLLFGLETKIPHNFPKISLVLSGGGARGFAQIGILKAFENLNLPINSIVGTSMGSIVGGLYSTGYSISDIDSMLSIMDWDLFSSANDANRNELFLDNKLTEDRAIFSIRFDGFQPVFPNALSSGQRVMNFLNSLTLNAPLQIKSNFSELLYDFYAVSTNIVNGDAVILHEGSLSKSIRASSSVSFLLSPVKFDSLLLADGGLVANVPINIARDLGSDFIIGINTTSALRIASDLKSPIAIADQVISIPINILTKEHLKNADYLLTPNLKGKRNNDFSNLNKIIKLGYDAANQHAQNIQSKVDKLIQERCFNDSLILRKFISLDSDNFYEKILNENYSQLDSVSLGKIKFDLYNIIKSDTIASYQIFIEPAANSSLHLRFNYSISPIIKSVKLNSTSPFISTLFSTSLDSIKGKPFSPIKLQNSLINALRLLRKKGYSLVNIENLFFDKKLGELTINLSDGILNDIRIVGNIKTDDEVIFRELEFRKNDIFNIQKLSQGLDNLRAANLFDEVDVVLKNYENKNILVINVIEKLPLVIRFGLKVDNEYYARILLDIRNENLSGTGTELGASFLIGPRNRFISIEHKTNRIFDTYLTYKLKGFYSSEDISLYSNRVYNSERFEREKVGEYTQTSTGISLGVGMQIKKAGNFIVEARYQRDKIDSIFNSSYLIYSYPLSILRASFNIDTQDRFPFPRKGILLNTYYETSQTILGSNIGYTKLFFEYNSFFTIQNSSTIKISSLIGAGDKTLPLSQQFSLGGQNNFFGYNIYDFRGRQIFISSIECQYLLPIQIFYDTYLKVRYDLGAIWENREDIKFKDLRHAAGLTVAFDTPIGPAEFAVGKSFLFKKEIPKSKIVMGETFFYFTIGYYL